MEYTEVDIKWKEDIPLILEKLEQLGLELVVSKHKTKWQMLHLKSA